MLPQKKKDNPIFEEREREIFIRVKDHIMALDMDHYWHVASNSDVTLTKISIHEKYREERED